MTWADSIAFSITVICITFIVMKIIDVFWRRR